jgi:caa(3)-type oxidase subunit IV
MASETHDHSHSNKQSYYVKIWAILLVLLLISIVGPFAEIRILTLLTAFGVAVIKAIMVASEFMHLRFEKRFLTYMLLTMLLLMGVLYFGVAPDVGTGGGQNWVRKPIATEAIHAESPHTDVGETK